MLATVLNTPVAVEASVRVVEAFVRMRKLFEAIRQLIVPPAAPRRRIGFKT